MSHLSPEALIDIAEGTRPESSTPHLAVCRSCREQLADLREMMATVAVDVPEPSPLFWDHLSARVREAVAAEGPGSTPWWKLGRRSWRLAAGMSVAVIAIAGSLTLRPARGPDAVSTVVTPAAVGNGAVSADDPSLSLLSDLARDLDWDAAAEAGITMEVGAADGALTELTSAERTELQRLLREAMSGSGV